MAMSWILHRHLWQKASLSTDPAVRLCVCAHGCMSELSGLKRPFTSDVLEQREIICTLINPQFPLWRQLEPVFIFISISSSGMPSLLCSNMYRRLKENCCHGDDGQPECLLTERFPESFGVLPPLPLFFLVSNYKNWNVFHDVWKHKLKKTNSGGLANLKFHNVC